jgi:hypothetical protein
MPIFTTPTTAGSKFSKDYDGQFKLMVGRGTRTWTVPAGVDKIFVAIVGAGGSGSRYINTDASTRIATGGGGGGFAGAELDVTAGSTYTIALGAGGFTGSLAAGANGVDGESSEFKNASGIALLTGGGGKGGVTGSSLSARDVLSAGAGGTGSVDSSVGTYVTSSGGRGGNFWYYGGGTSGYAACTGGGASGWLVGDGGNGGDISQLNPNAFGTDAFTGGGGWGGGNGGGVGAMDNTLGGYAYTGGGGYINSGGNVAGDINTNTIYTGGGCPFYAGNTLTAQTYLTGALINNPSTSYANNAPYFTSAEIQKMNWWRILTGEALMNAHPNILSFNMPPGCGAAGGYRKGGIGGGDGAGQDTQIDGNMWDNNIGGASPNRIGGGGGAGWYYRSTTLPYSQLSNFTLPTKTSTEADGIDQISMPIQQVSAPFGGGSGGIKNSSAANKPAFGGDGFCVILW